MRSRSDRRAWQQLAKRKCPPAGWGLIFATCTVLTDPAATPAGSAEFHSRIQPILQEYCFDCHGDGAHKGNVAFDEFKSDEVLLENHELWFKALKNLRAGLMPPPQKPHPTLEQKQLIEQ